jgi:uncharacterized Rmd1/YagE family protein
MYRGGRIMKTYDFKSTVVANEINLNVIAAHFGISKKFKWEEPLVLGEKNLEGIILQPENKFVYIFYFGTIVFINLVHHEMQDILNYLKSIKDDYTGIAPFEYIDDFKLVVADDIKPEKGEKIEFEISYDYASISKLNNYVIDIISTVLAKSVALEMVEHDIGILIDEIEKLIEFLDKGRLEFSDKQLAKLSSKILRYKYDTISYVYSLYSMYNLTETTAVLLIPRKF